MPTNGGSEMPNVPDDFIASVNEEVRVIMDSEGYSEMSDAFTVWFLREILEQDETEADENASIQGSGDQGIDAYWQDNREEQVFAIQVKHSESGRESYDDRPIQELRHGIECLKDLNRATRPTGVFVEKSREFGNAIGSGFRVNGAVVLLGDRGPRFQTEEDRLRSWLREEFDGNAELSIYDLDRLFTTHQEILSRADEPAISAEIEMAEAHEFEINGIRAVAGTCRLLGLIELFWDRKFSLFEKNPRYQLPGSNKVNQGIKATVSDTDEAPRFWLYNNGITAICSDMTLEGNVLSVEDFQVVNGCQTIATVAHAIDEMREQTDGGEIPEHIDNVTVFLRVIQTGDEALAGNISKYTNSQSVVTDADRRSDDSVQRRLERLCDRLDPPWYYERKRGGWLIIPAAERGRRYGRGREKRLLKREDAAKIRLSFVGDPVTARTKPKSLFDPDETHYRSIFDSQLYAEHYVVPWRFYQEFRRAVNSRRERLKELLGRDNLPTEREIELRQLTAAKYGTYHLVGLVGYFIREKYGTESREVLRFLLEQDLASLAGGVVSRGLWILGDIAREEDDIQNYFKRPESWQDLQVAAITRIGEAGSEGRDYLEFMPELT